jgi:hypothetical protein
MSAFNLTVKPAQIEIILRPNASYVRAYDVTNNSSEAVLLTTSISPWVPADNLGSVTYLDSQEQRLDISLSNADLKLGQDFVLKPNQKKQLVLKIKNPTTDESDHYLTFFVSQKPLNNSIIGRQNLAKIGSHILVSTTNQKSITSNLEISQFITKPFIKDIFSKIKIEGEIFNNGNHYSQINGQIKISKNGQPYWEQNLFPYTITSQNSRLIQCLNSQNEAETCQLKMPIWPGVYRGTISLSGNSSKYEYSFNFFIFPYSIIIAITVLFLLLTFLLKKPAQNIKHC